MIKWLLFLKSPTCVPNPLYFKVFANCEFNSDLHETSGESLELAWKNARQVL